MDKNNTKKCRKCEVEKDLSEFYRAERSYCKDCERQEARWRMSRTENKLRVALKDSRRSAEKYGVYDDLTIDDVRYAFKIANGRCGYCDKLVGRNLEVDHIFSLSSGGHNTLSNILPACSDCNSGKGAESVLTHIQTTSYDVDTLNAIVDRIAYRRGVKRWEIEELLNRQQSDVFRRETEKLIRKIKKRE